MPHTGAGLANIEEGGRRCRCPLRMTSILRGGAGRIKQCHSALWYSSYRERSALLLRFERGEDSNTSWIPSCTQIYSIVGGEKMLHITAWQCLSSFSLFGAQRRVGKCCTAFSFGLKSRREKSPFTLLRFIRASCWR